MSDSFNLDVDIADALSMLDDLPKQVNRGVNKETKVTAFKIMASAVKSISASPSQGKKYGNHTASKAGDAPNTDTGNLVQSIKVIRSDKATKGAKGYSGLNKYLVGSALNYAAWLEFGTLDNKLKKRPWLEPAVDKVAPDHVKRITKAVKKAINDAEQ